MPLARSSVANVIRAAPIATVIQLAVKDPATGNRDDCFLTQSNSLVSGTFPPGNTGVGQAASLFTSVPARTYVCMAGCANDFGTGPSPAGNKVTLCYDPVNGQWPQLFEQLNNINDCNFDARIWWFPGAQPLLSTSWTGTGAVSSGGILTIGSGSGPFRINQRINSAHTPAVGIAGGETIVVSLLSGSLGAAGSTYQLGGGIGSTTFSSEAMTTTDVVLIQRTQSVSSNFADYPGAALFEVSGNDGINAYCGGANPVATGNSVDNVSTGGIVMPNVPGIMLAMGFNGGVNEGAGGVFAPNAGTGFTNSQKILSYDQGQPICTLEWQHFASLGTRAATFTPVANVTSNYLLMAIGLPDAP